MNHIIDGQSVNLRELTAEELNDLVTATRQRQERLQEELESLLGEHIRRSPNVYQLHFEFEGPAIQSPPYLRDPA